MGDLKLSARSLRKNPGFTAVAVLTLALGVGANTAIFSVLKAVVLNPLPYRDPDRLVKVSETDFRTVNPVTVDFTTTHDLRARSRSFQSLSLYRGASGAIAGNGEPELLRGLRVSHDYFETLGVPMQLGRSFRPEEDRAAGRFVLVLTHGLWKGRFGGDPQIVGRTIRLSDASFQVVGVLPANFHQLNPEASAPQIFMPLGYELGQGGACRGCQHLQLIGRLKPGVTPAAAEAELNGVMRGIVSEHPKDYAEGAAVLVQPLRSSILGKLDRALWVLLGAVGFVLLIACANVANLVLARATGRSREMALRAALGAGRGRLVRQLLAESLALALAGGVAGIVLAWWGTSALSALGPTGIPRLHEIRIDLPVLLYALGASVLTAVLFGLAPALRLSRVELTEALKGMGKSTEGRGASGLRNALVTAELALAFVLVLGAGLLGRSFVRLVQVDLGFDPRNVITAQTYVYGERYQSDDAELALYDRVFERLRATPGVESVAMTSTLPLSGFDRRGFHRQDRKLANDSDAPSVDGYSVSPDYFRVMRIPLRRGRLLAAQDGPKDARVAVISESCARLQFPGEDPIGKQIQLGGSREDRPWITIVGVVGDVRQRGPERASDMEAYIAQAQDLSFSYTLVARTTGDPSRFEQAVRAAFLEADRTQPVFRVRPLESYAGDMLAQRSFTLALLAVFGLLALSLAAVGIYGVFSYAVTLRTRELGIRMALGAERRDVVAMVLRQGARLIVPGLLAGFAVSAVVTRYLSTMLFEVKPGDVATSVAVAVILAVVALVATWLPARRAATVDPMVALREE